jgi:hypothetical protein
MAEAQTETVFELWEYVGPGGLLVHGFATGASYRFPFPGARLAVDPRDGEWWKAIPYLRRCL